jgi:hypothetical protein
VAAQKKSPCLRISWIDANGKTCTRSSGTADPEEAEKVRAEMEIVLNSGGKIQRGKHAMKQKRGGPRGVYKTREIPDGAYIDPPRGYDAVNEAAQELGVSVQALTLGKQTDPFYCGADNQRRDAEWFVGLFRRLGFPRGVHLRRCHYTIQALNPPVATPRPIKYAKLGIEKSVYENTYECWQLLSAAGKYARHLGLVDPDLFDDRRNPDVQVFAEYEGGDRPEPTCEVGEPDWKLPGIIHTLGERVELEMPEPCRR